MTEIKICGITSLEDARTVAESGADALGFIFYAKSPRYISPERVKDISQLIPRDIVRVGVFVNHPLREVQEIVRFCGLDMIQLHGNEPPEYCRHFPSSVIIKALSPRTEQDLQTLDAYPAGALLIDTYDPGRYGGTGKLSNWMLAALIKKRRPLVLSGGLGTDNIVEALRTVTPHAVDINSGVETAPGEKDPHKVRNIIDLVRQTKEMNDSTTVKIFNRDGYADWHRGTLG
jgi:phosphoribosylanthranilate isomerase